MEKWFVASKRADFNKIGEVFHISPVTARLMRNRDLTTIEEMQRYLYGSLSDLYDPHLLKDADKGAEIIKEKIEAGKKIRIISDYDVDGVSSNYILYQGLKRCGADVDYKIPDRVEDGYGINEHIIEKAAADGIHMMSVLHQDLFDITRSILFRKCNDNVCQIFSPSFLYQILYR